MSVMDMGEDGRKKRKKERKKTETQQVVIHKSPMFSHTTAHFPRANNAHDRICSNQFE